MGQIPILCLHEHLRILDIYQPHDGEYPLQTVHQFLCIPHALKDGHRDGVVSWKHPLVDIDGLPHRPQISWRVSRFPNTPGENFMPTIFPVHGKHRGDVGVRILRRGGMDGVPQAHDIRVIQEGSASLREMGYLFSLCVLGRPVGQRQCLGQRVILELHDLLHTSEEIRLCLLHPQYIEHVVLIGRLFAAQEPFRKPRRLGEAVPVLRLGLPPAVLPALQLHQALQQQRLKRAAFSPQDHSDGGIMVEGLFVAALTGQRVIHVRQSNHLGGNGDLLALQTIRISSSVIALVVPAADLDGGLEQGRPVLLHDLLQKFRTGRRMGLHQFKFLCRQPSRLIEHLLRDIDLSNVMEGGGCADLGNLTLGQTVAVRFLRQPQEEAFRQRADVQHMSPAFPVPELHDVAEDIDHHAVAALALIDLFRHQSGQSLLLCVQQKRVDHPPPHHGHLKGAVDVIHRAQIIGPLHIS